MTERVTLGCDLSQLKNIYLYFRKWTVANGIDGETCTDWKTGDTELWCAYARIPSCADRRIYCTEPPQPERATIKVTNKPNTLNNRQYLTSIEYACPDKKYYFNYPVGDNFVSYYYTNNVNSINVTCNQDG